jgi:outer membrane receptor for ferric coprogen and ferric-rhodotorulic acid
VCSADYRTFGFSDNPSSSYGSDSLWSYELGAKGRALGNSLSFNAAGYYVNWRNLQQAIYLPTCGYYDTVNIGNARSYGTELEMHFKPEAVRGLTLGVSGGANHATLTSSNNLLTARPGQYIPYSPRWTADASVDYGLPFGASRRAFASWDFDYTGPSNGTYQTSNPNYNNPSYGVMNLTLGADLPTWQVAVFARNLLNNHTIIQSPTINALVEGYAVQPRTVGLRITKNY